MENIPNANNFGSSDVHTMPDKFLIAKPTPTMSPQSSGGKPKRSKASIIIIIVIVIAVVAILAGAGYLVYINMPKKDTTNTNINAENSNSAVNTNSNLNSNQNSNVNANANKNTNKNLNSNKNSNTNTDNSNSNLNSNSNANANVNTNTNTYKPVIKMLDDADSDSLTNAEETLYNSQNDKPDSDADGYLDGEELMNGYNPNGSGKLADTNVVKTYSNSNNGYAVLYPTTWIEQNLEETNDNVIFTPNNMADAGEFLEVITDVNSNSLTALDWYLSQNSSVKASELTVIQTKDGLEGVLSIDGYTAYFAGSDSIYAITYSFGTSTELNYITTFKMMYQNFKLIPKVNTDTTTNSNTNTNTNTNTNVNVNS